VPPSAHKTARTITPCLGGQVTRAPTTTASRTRAKATRTCEFMAGQNSASVCNQRRESRRGTVAHSLVRGTQNVSRDVLRIRSQGRPALSFKRRRLGRVPWGHATHTACCLRHSGLNFTCTLPVHAWRVLAGGSRAPPPSSVVLKARPHSVISQVLRVRVWHLRRGLMRRFSRGCHRMLYGHHQERRTAVQ